MGVTGVKWLYGGDRFVVGGHAGVLGVYEVREGEI